MCFTEAIRLGNPTPAVLLQKTQPSFAALLARLLLRERLGRRFWFCLLLAFCGAWLVSFDTALPLPSGRIAAALLALAATALWGGATVLGRYLLRKLPFTTVTALRIVLAAPPLLALAGAQASRVGAREMGLLVILAVVPGLLALLVYIRGLAGTRASLAAVAELSFPATAALLNWTLLDFRISAVHVAGFAVLWAISLKWEPSNA